MLLFFPYLAASIVTAFELFDVRQTHHSVNNYTIAQTGCPCFYDENRKEDCPCCKIDQGACPCSWPYDDRCGDCFSGHGCVPEPLNQMQTVSDRGCACQDVSYGNTFNDRTCACCFPSGNTCPCAYPYHHMCADCNVAHDCSVLAFAEQYREHYPSYFEQEQRALRMQHDFQTSAELVCQPMELEMENGFVLCDKEMKEGKSCMWFCDKHFELVGNERAECTCGATACYWNDDANFRPPYCEKNPCSPNPCGPGECVSNAEGFVCNCPPGYLGEGCEMPDVSYDNSHLIADDEGAFSSFLAGRQESMADILDSRRTEPEKPRGLALPENTCPALEPGPNAKLKCSDGNRSRSSCFLTCENGFRVVNKKFAAPTCNCNNYRCYWDRRRKFQLAKCVDWPDPIGNNVNDATLDGPATIPDYTSKREFGNCIPLVQPKFGSMKCTRGGKGVDGTICTFACKKGYALSKSASAKCECRENKCKWNQENFYTEPLCQDRDECKVKIHNCINGLSTCVNKPGSFVCLPNDSPILRECDSRPCGRGGTCEIGAQGYRCRCKDGFRLNRGTCRDINECTLRIDKCHDDAVCENNTGGYACRCMSGFGDGISSCVEERSKLTCLQRRSLRFDPMPNYVAPNACCQGVAFHTDLKCCCDGSLHPQEACPCLKIDYKNVL